MRAKPVKEIRVILFALWCVIFVSYVGLFLAVGHWRDDVIDAAEARDAARQVAYIFLPVLGAFAGFWFTPEKNGQSPSVAGHDSTGDDATMLSGDKVFAVFALTSVVHVVVLGYFILYVVLGDFYLSPDVGESFVDVVAWGLNLLVALSSLTLLPVGFLTKKTFKPIHVTNGDSQ